MTRSTNMEHVEVLRDLSEVCRAAIKAGDWKVDGACDPDAVLRRADAAIAALSAPQPPAEAQPVAWEWEYIGVDQYPRGHKVARSLREMDPTNPPYPETWRPTRPLIYGDTAPPSAPVGVDELVRKVCERLDKVADYAHTIDDETVVVALSNLPAVLDRALSEALAQQPAAVVADGFPPDVQEIIRRDEAAWALAERAEAAGAERDSDDNETWWTLRIEQFYALAQQPAAVDEVEQLTEQQAVIVTGYTGTLCGSFGAFHADLEKRAGRSVFTHEMSDFGWIKSLYRDDFIALTGQHGGPHDDR